MNLVHETDTFTFATSRCTFSKEGYDPIDDFYLCLRPLRATNLWCELPHFLKAVGYKGGLLLPSYIIQHTWSSILSYETCSQHRICALGHKPFKRHCFHQHKLPEKPVTLTTPTYQQDNISQWPTPWYSRFKWEICSLPVWIASRGVSSSSVLCLFLPLSQSSQHHCYGHFHSAQQTHSFQIL